ncbi:MAG: HNH endonuclease [Patescibacteria group bacterium]
MKTSQFDKELMEFKARAREGKVDVFVNPNEINSYKDYLNSPQWKTIKMKYYRKNKRICRLCGSRENLHLHHVGYSFKNLFEGKIGNLISLCKSCHLKVEELPCSKRKTVKK